jgi:hypothetical protein
LTILDTLAAADPIPFDPIPFDPIPFDPIPQPIP